jgi:hypothetical protein
MTQANNLSAKFPLVTIFLNVVSKSTAPKKP